MIKKILLLKLVALCLTSSLFSGLREIGYLENMDNLPSMMAAKGFLPSETALVFDIDGTLVVESEPLFNQELCREQKDHMKKLATKLQMDAETIWHNILHFKEKEDDYIRFVEETIPTIIQNLYAQGTSIFTCTRSVFGYPRDHRLNFMKKNDVDFSSFYKQEHFSIVPFFNPQSFGYQCNEFEKALFRGHSSADQTSKSAIINEIVEALKEIKEIKNIVFVDNFFDEVEDVCDNCKGVENVLSVYYVRVREDTKIKTLVESYKKFEQKYFPSNVNTINAESILKDYDDIENLGSAPAYIPKCIDFGISSKKPVLHAPQPLKSFVSHGPNSLLALFDSTWKMNPDEVPVRPSSNSLLDMIENYTYGSDDEFYSEEDSEF